MQYMSSPADTWTAVSALQTPVVVSPTETHTQAFTFTVPAANVGERYEIQANGLTVRSLNDLLEELAAEQEAGE